MIEEIRTFMMACPYIVNFQHMLVDYLVDKNNSFSIEPVPTDTIIDEYLDGSTVEQYVFVLAGRLHYSDEIRNNIENSDIFENVKEWVKEQSDAGNFPALASGLTPTKMEVMSSGYLMGVSNDYSSAVYQIQCRLIYERG